ncbi:hypothetical protein [Thalassotalea sediminis]|uniref:hypothetical protein n=1 Tax=Thalassotalea sediminis TaxID=1759089 RepID=UPI00257332F6|nr:hypothetical protein [Thalassotalea sediminis]
MDIFTTALTRVRTTPIKPDKLRVKSLSKQAATKALSDDLDHLEDHELYFVKDAHSHAEQQQESPTEQETKANSESESPQYVVDEIVEPEILHKQDVLHPKHQEEDKDDDDDQPHLDIYV